jgi:hydroxymethylpyrimidine/phosphomethylpyrimidine kinase
MRHALTIAGSDGSGGAGIQADLKTFSALHCYGMTVVTAVTAQNTQGVRSVCAIDSACIEEQIHAIFDDIDVHAVKIGMLHDRQVIASVARLLRHYAPPYVVLDPVMVAKSGCPLLQPEAVSALKEFLVPLATVLTPNLPEAEALLGRLVRTRKEMERAAIDLAALGAQAVVVKGGHLDVHCDDCLYAKGRFYWLEQPKIATRNTHGTGCTFAAAIAAFLAREAPIEEAVVQAKRYLTQAIEGAAAWRIGSGHGPVHHFHHLWKPS